MRLMPLLLLLACQGNVGSQAAPSDDFEEPTDEDAPLITHTPVEDTQPFGTVVPIEATVDDGDGAGVLFVYLYYKNETGGADAWQNSIMSSKDGVTWSGSIPGDASDNSAGVFYYIEAIDANENTAWAPTRGPDDPFHYGVS